MSPVNLKFICASTHNRIAAGAQKGEYMPRKGKQKKRIPKLSDKKKQGLDQDVCFEEYLNNHKFNPDDKYDDEPITETTKTTDLVSSHIKDIYEATIDLHGLTSRQAVSETRKFIEESLLICRVLRLKVITGRGVGSGSSGPVLVKDVYNFIAETYKASIIEIDLSPFETRLGGVCVRGHFFVTIRA